MDGGDSAIIILPAGDAAEATADTMPMIVRAPPADGADAKEEIGNRQTLASYSTRVSRVQNDDFRMLQRTGDAQTKRNLDEPVAEEQNLTAEPEMLLYASRTENPEGHHFLQR